MADDDFLRRWSRRKAEAKRAPATAVEPPVTPLMTPSDQTAAEARPGVIGRASAVAAAPEAVSSPAALPDPARLEPGADVSAFMARGVDEALKRRALKSLFQDPRFNVMDGLDVYIDDYSIPDPMPPEWLDTLEQISHLGDRGERDRAARAGEALAGEGADAERSGAVAAETADAGARQAEPASAPVAGPPATEGLAAGETAPPSAAPS